jgi:hypothetical protein
VRPGSIWLAAWAALPLLGAPLLLHPAYRSYSKPARVALAGAVGSVLLSFGMTLTAVLGLPWVAAPLALAALSLSGALRLGVKGSAAAVLPPADAAALAALFVAAAVAAAFLATFSGAAGSSDLLFFWGPKAQAFAQARTIDAGFLGSGGAVHMHPYYPPLVTNLYAFSTMAAGRFAWGAAALTFPLLLAALAAALPSLLRSAERPYAPAAVSALAVSSLALLGAEADIAGNADMPLLFFEILGIALLLAPAPAERPRLLLAGILLAGAATAKVEGLPFVLAAAGLFLAGSGRKSGVRTSALLLAPTALSLGAWFLFGATREAFGTYGEYGSLLELRWDRVGLVLSEIARTLWSNGFALPYLVPVAVLIAARAGVRRLPLAVGAALSGFLLVTYLLPARNPVAWIQWSAARTFAPITALSALALAAPVLRGQAKKAIAASRESPEIQSPETNERGQ